MSSLPEATVQINPAFAGYVTDLKVKNPGWTDNQCAEFINEWAAKIAGEKSDDAVAVNLTEADQKFISEDDRDVNDLMSLTEKVLDPKNMLSNYVSMGNAALKIARRRKASFKLWDKDCFDSMCLELKNKALLRLAITSIDYAKFIRLALWVEMTKVSVPNVKELSYYQAVNIFMPTTLAFSAVDLTAEIRKDWQIFNTAAVTRQLGDDKLPVKALQASIEETKAAIIAAKASKVDPEKALEREQKAADSKIRKDREKAQSAIADSVDKAIINGQATAADIMDVVEKVAKSHKLDLPKPVLDMTTAMGMWATCTKDDILALTNIMFANGKFVEMRFLRDRLDAMIKTVDNSLVASKTA